MNVEITVFSNRYTPYGVVYTLKWEDLKDRLRDPVVTSETMEEYQLLEDTEESKAKTDAKDVGGFVGGPLEKGKRDKKLLKYRTVLTIDADDAKQSDVDDFLALNDYVFCCHTTHSSTKEQLRLRWVFPLSRGVSDSEYVVLVDKFKHLVGAETLDESTDQPTRLMFWSSHPKDAEFGFWEGGSTYLDPDEFLGEIDAQEYLELQEAAKKKLDDFTNDAGIEVGEGDRNNSAYSVGASLRNLGYDIDGILHALEDWNDRYVKPPLPHSELESVARSVCKGIEPGEPILAELRTMYDDFTDLGEGWKPKEKQNVETLQAESLASLALRDIPEPVFVIPGLLPYGLTSLSAEPKMGKSWMALDIAISVATGTQFLGQDTNKTGVIYCALEDNDYRLKSRGLKVAGNRTLPYNLFLVQEAPALEDDLLPKLDTLIHTCGGGIGLIIIDTLQMIRGMAKRQEGAYQYDYRELSPLHQFALDHNMAILVLHHTNKGKTEGSVFQKVNGTAGVNGSSDGMIVLDKENQKSDHVKMHITGRDVGNRTLVISFDQNTCRWISLGEEEDVEESEELAAFDNDPVVKTIVYKLDEIESLSDRSEPTVSWACTSQELLDVVSARYGATEFTGPTAIGRHIRNLLHNLDVKLGIAYDYRAPHGRREHVFTRDVV